MYTISSTITRYFERSVEKVIKKRRKVEKEVQVTVKEHGRDYSTIRVGHYKN